MTLPNKKRGFRQITIDWEDPWLLDRANIHLHHLHPCSSPVTPNFVAMAIEESIKLGWQPESNITKFNVNYQAGKFTLQS